MPPRRRRTTRPVKRPEASRVVRVTTHEGWDKMLNKNKGRLVVVHFTATWAALSRAIRPFLIDCARKKQYSHIAFVEVDYESLQDLSDDLGVTGCPTIVFWKDDAVLEKLPAGNGSMPAKIAEGIQKYGGEKPQSRLRSLLKKAAIVLAAATVAGVAYHQMNKPPPTAAQQAAILDRQMEAVNSSLTQAIRQRQNKIVTDLQKQLQRLAEQRQAISSLTEQAEAEEDRLSVGQKGDDEDVDLSEPHFPVVKWDDEGDDEAV